MGSGRILAEPSLRACSAVTRKYRFIAHTADIRVVVYGNTLPQLFEHAAQSLSAVLTDVRTIRGSESRVIAVRGSGLESVLVAWLSELLYLFDTGGWLFRRFGVEEVNQRGLRALAWGECCNEMRHVIKTQVKAVTFHQLAVREEGGRWVTRIVYDI